MNSLEVALKVKTTELQLSVYLTVRIKSLGFCLFIYVRYLGVAFDLHRVRSAVNYKKCLPKLVKLRLRIRRGMIPISPAS